MTEKGLSFTRPGCVDDLTGFWKVIAFIWTLFEVPKYLPVHLLPLDDLWESSLCLDMTGEGHLLLLLICVCTYVHLYVSDHICVCVYTYVCIYISSLLHNITDSVSSGRALCSETSCPALSV